MAATSFLSTKNGIVPALWSDRLQDATWRLCNGDSVRLLRHEAYIRYFHQLQSYVAHELGVRDRIQDIGLISDVAQQLRSNFSKTDVVTDLMGKLGNEQNHLTAQYCEEIVIYIARLLVMVNVGRLMSEAYVPRHLPWDSGSLRDCIGSYFTKSNDLSCTNVKLSKAFNAWTIETIGGIRIRFTDDLSDHLLLTEDDSAVLIFHQASFLESQHQQSVLFLA